MQVRIPDLSETDNEMVLTVWHVKESGHVTEGDDLFEVVTDKASFDITAPCSGILAKIFKKSGERTKPGDIVAEIQEDE